MSTHIKMICSMLTAVVGIFFAVPHTFATTHQVTTETELNTAIISATAGDTIEIVDGSSLTLGNLQISKALTIDGLSTATIKPETAQRAMYVTANNVVIRNLKFISDTHAPLYTGGFIWANAAVTNISFEKNTFTKGLTTSQNGGALSLSSAFTGKFVNNIFTENKGDMGGAVYVAGVYKPTDEGFVGNTFHKNEGTAGGAISFNSGATAGTSGVLVHDSIFTENIATTGGGAIYANNSFTGDITDSVFEKNKSANAGGAIQISGSFTGDIINSKFIGNEATRLVGGAITAYMYGTIQNSLFDGNKAGLHGGAIDAGHYDADFTVIDTTFINNQSTSGFGGAISMANDWSSAYTTTMKLTLEATAGNEVLFQGNTDKNGANSIALGAYAPYKSVFPPYPTWKAASDILLTIQGAGDVKLLDPIYVKIDNNKNFTLNAKGTGNFEWGGNNIIISDNTVNINFISGNTTFMHDFILQTDATDGGNTKFDIQFQSGHNLYLGIDTRNTDQAYIDFANADATSTVTFQDGTQIAGIRSLTELSGKYLLVNSQDVIVDPLSGWDSLLAAGFDAELLLENGGKELWLNVKGGSPLDGLDLTPNAIRSIPAVDEWLKTTAEGQAADFEKIKKGMNTINSEIGITASIAMRDVHWLVVNTYKGAAFADTRHASQTIDIEKRIDTYLTQRGKTYPKKTDVDVWAAYLGNFGRYKTKDRYAGFDADTSGVLAGATINFCNNMSLGAYGGYSYTKTSFLENMGTIKTDGIHGGLYGRYDTPIGLNIGVDFNYSRFDNDSERFPAGIAINTASFNQDIFSVGAEVGYDLLPWKNGRITPFVEVRNTWIRQDEYTENGYLAHRMEKVSEDELSTTVGATLEHAFVINSDTIFLPALTVGWKHNYGDSQLSTNTSIVGVPVTYMVKSRDQAQDLGLVGIDLQGLFGKNWAVRAAYGAQIGDKVTDHNIFSISGLDSKPVLKSDRPVFFCRKRAFFYLIDTNKFTKEQRYATTNI